MVPILLASRELSPVPLAIHSGHRLDIDLALDLTGECEFILAAAPPVPPLRAPIVEAKKNDIKGGLGRCVAQIVAVRLFNEAAGRGGRPVHGCLTTGEVWQFLRLYEKVTLIDRRRYYLDDVAGVLSGFQAIIASGAG